MEKLTEVLTMGGYAAYVWPSFIAAGLVMSAMVALSLRSLKRSQKMLGEIRPSVSPSGNEA